MAKKQKKSVGLEGLADAIRSISMQKEEAVFNAFASVTPDSVPANLMDFATDMAFYSLIHSAKHLIRTEWEILYASAHDLKKNKARWLMEAVEHKKIFARQYDVLLKKFGEEKFVAGWKKARDTENGCSRANLDNSEGMIYCYIIPEMNPDGTHEVLKKEDGPWGQIEKKLKKKHNQGPA